MPLQNHHHKPLKKPHTCALSSPFFIAICNNNSSCATIRSMNKVTTKNHLFYFLITTTFFLFPTRASDTMGTAHTFTDDGDTLISSSGIFELGFFTPQTSQNRYVGIWYKNILNKTVVWVANHESPLIGKASALRLVDPGILVLEDSNKTTIWSTNASKSVRTPVATLLDSGNLVIKDASDDDKEENFLWQSFDYPTNTFLAGMKLGKNFVTGKEFHITSPKTEDDPASGDYTFTCDPTGYLQCLTRKGDAVTSRGGPWNGNGFSGVPTLKKNGIFTYEVVMNEEEVYYHFELLNNSIPSRLVLNEKGVGTRLNWVETKQEWLPMNTIPSDICDTYKECGPYGICNINNPTQCGCLERFRPSDSQEWESGDWSKGCIRSTPLNCGKDGFKKYSNIKLPDTRSSWYNKSMNLEECKEFCLKNCSCMGYTSLDISTSSLAISRDGTGCLLWFDDLVDMREAPSGQVIHVRVAYSDSDRKQGKHKAVIIITLCLVVTIGVVVICLVMYARKRKKADHQWRQESDCSRLNNADNLQDEIPPNNHMDLQTIFFDLEMLMRATNSFSQDNKLGEGGFGQVYKATLEDGQEVAVKRLSRTSLQGVDEFKNEVMCIAELQHRNLVKLLGCCIHGDEKMLVYEYLTNRSLDLILFHPVNNILLDWPRRFNIINGIARGLLYLHQDSRLRVIHRDLKASNILLDSNMNPKISDFGLARTFGGDETESNTSRVIGTYGYMSPEYVVEGQFSVKSDVFSFGVLVLEIVSGMRNRRSYQRDRRVNLLGHAWMLYKEDNSSELIDPCLGNSCDLTEVIRLVHIGLLCVQELPEDRPNMSSVVLMLNNGGALPEPKHPGFFKERDLLKNESSVSSNASNSTNFMTITLPEAR